VYKRQLEGPSISVTRVLEIMDVRNPRRESFRGRPAIDVYKRQILGLTLVRDELAPRKPLMLAPPVN